MSRIQKFEQLEALQRACSRYSIAASYFPIWNSSACALLFSTSSSARCFTRGVVHSVHIFPGKGFYLGDHQMCRFLAISDATILCQEFLQLHYSVASLLSKTRELENTKSTVRQWELGTGKLIAMGVLSWFGNFRLRFSTLLKMLYGGWPMGGKNVLSISSLVRTCAVAKTSRCI